MFDPANPNTTEHSTDQPAAPPKPSSVPFPISEAPASASSQPAATSYPFRLLADEVMLGIFPVARADRPLGKLASFLFVTDSRLVYSAEAKTLTSSSIHNKEFHIQKIDGIEVARHSGYDALGIVALIGSILNFLVLLILGIVTAGASSGSNGFSSSFNPLGWLGAFLIPLAVASLVIGVVVALVFRRPQASISVIGPDKSQTLSEERDLPQLLVMLLLFLIFGVFIGVVLLAWLVVREAGVFRAVDAQKFAPVQNVDRVAYQAGALILDVQARGKLAEKV